MSDHEAIIDHPLLDAASQEAGKLLDGRNAAASLLTAVVGAGIVSSTTGSLLLAAFMAAPALIQYVVTLVARNRAIWSAAQKAEQLVTPSTDPATVDPVTLARVPLVPVSSVLHDEDQAPGQHSLGEGLSPGYHG